MSQPDQHATGDGTNDRRSQERWRLWVDTGGTFTDCIGLRTSGTSHEIRRAKVLSSGALRGRASGMPAPNMLRVGPEWLGSLVQGHAGAAARALIGMRLHIVGAAGEGAMVRSCVASRGILELDSPVPALAADALFELSASEEAPVLGARLLTGTPLGIPLPPVEMRLGTTRGTNALLEGRGDRVAFFITEGHADSLEIGTQQRPSLFALQIHKDAPRPARVAEVPGRLSADGREIEPLNLARPEHAAREALKSGITSAAVALMHSWANPEHEQQLAAFLLELGFQHVSLSSELAPLIKILSRAQTALVNAQLAGVMERYLARVAEGIGPRQRQEDGRRSSRLHVMTSSGGLAAAPDFRPKDSLLSGPAGGVVGASAAGMAAGFSRLIAFDMGGTSTDVSRFDGEYQYVFEHAVGSARIVAPALAIETVAAGGGSVCMVDGGLLRVGPESAGAHPGPACYGAGGPLTITDCNLLLGRLDPDRFGIPIDEHAAHQRLTELQREALRQRENAGIPGNVIDADALAEGFITLACERMAEAIGRISLRQGYDAADYALVAFGGAGGQHACAVATRLGMSRILLPVDAGLLSAAGLGRAALERFAARQVLQPAAEVALDELMRQLADEAVALVHAEGAQHASPRRRLVEMRLAGQESTLTIEHPDGAPREALPARFAARYEQLYGHPPPDRVIEIESARVVASAEEPDWGGFPSLSAAASRAAPSPVARRRARFDGRWMEVPVYERTLLEIGANLTGPALIVEAHSTSIIEPGWTGTVHGTGAILLTRHAAAALPLAGGTETIRSEVAAGRLAAIAGDMGEMLRRTALSTNIKERLDFSCAILDAQGRLVVNAPHIPVHLGALGVCVRSIAPIIAMEPGDVVVTNHPAAGGSHLPDVTLITPVHTPRGELLAYVACRAHHAEIGGISPGSMPTRAHSLAEEGVVIPPTHLVRRGTARWEEIERMLSSGPWPSRSPEENLADLRAQLAANRYGAGAIMEFAAGAGEQALRDGMRTLFRRAAAGTSETIAQLGAHRASFAATEHLDDGSPISVKIDISPGRLVIDFAGSAPAHPGNLNATPAIVRSAVIYVLRLLVRDDLPLNEGLLSGVEINIPEGNALAPLR